MISVIIPTFNEKNNIFKILSKLKKIKIISEIIFVDDDSNDGTYNEIIKYKTKKTQDHLSGFLL
jgi:glycosyltransferase involved in cell wall biosynthesis